MKKLFFLFFLFPVIVFSQIQVSDIEYQLPRDDYPRKGFMKVGEEEYFIEQGIEGTILILMIKATLDSSMKDQSCMKSIGIIYTL